MNWVKSNWLIIVLSVVALAALPVMYFFSAKMNKDLRAKVDKDVQTDWKEVTNSKVTYSVPDVKKPDGKAFEKSTDVNEILTKKFAEARESIKRESSLIGAEAVKFNEGHRKPRLAGLFPKPADNDRIRLMNQFARDFIETMPQEMLNSVGARGPVEPMSLGASLAEYKKSREQRQAAIGGAGAMSQDEMAKLNQELFAQRIDRYRAWASQTCFYADMYAFQDVPTAVPNPLPPMSKLWDWQLKTWIYEDLFNAFALANSTAAGGSQGNVLTGAVKRVDKIFISNQDYFDTPDELAGSSPPDPSSIAAPKDPVTPDVSVSITGRYSGPTSGNQYYDLRTVTVEMIVSPLKLPMLFDALAKTNYMTVLKCDMEKLEPEASLKDGFYYGDEHVVKATLTIESLWLRAWTKKYMPGTVRTTLGIPEDKPAEDAAPVQPPQ